jgi:hypothetical protein
MTEGEFLKLPWQVVSNSTTKDGITLTYAAEGVPIIAKRRITNVFVSYFGNVAQDVYYYNDKEYTDLNKLLEDYNGK